MKKTLIVSILLSFSISGSAFAQVISNFQSTATLNSFCSISAEPLSFGNVNWVSNSSTEYQATSNINILCSKDASYSIENNREDSLFSMTGTNNNANILKYNLYTVSTRTITWGKKGSQFNYEKTFEGLGTGQNSQIIVYGSLIPGWNNGGAVNPDIYSGNVTATINF